MSRYTGGGGYLPLTWWLGGATVDLDFQNSRYYDFTAGGDGQAVTTYLSCSRASTGYAKTGSGTLTSFSTNTLRITDLGLLIEGSGTNLISNSEAANSWSLNALTVTTDTIAAPNGATTADKLVETAVTDEHKALNFILTGSNVPFTFSVYMKAAERTFSRLVFSDSATGTCAVAYDLTNGTTLSVSGSPGGSWTSVSGAIEAMGNGWYRCIITATRGAGSEVDCTMYLANSQGNAQAGAAAGYAGDGTSGLYVWGMQLEQTSFASSYVATTSGSVTRAADAITAASTLQTVFTGNVASTVANVQAEGAAGAATGNAGVFLVADEANGIALLGTDFNFPNTTPCQRFPTTSTGNVFGAGTLLGGVKTGSCWDAGADLASQVGGGGTVANFSSAVTAMTAPISIGKGGFIGFTWFGTFRRLTAWNTKLADATLQGLTV